MKDTTIVFMGTPEFAVKALHALNSAFTVVTVVTQPDKPAGRGNKLASSPVKNAAAELHIPVLQPQKMRDEQFLRTLKSLAPDYIVTAAYGKILPPAALEIPRIAALNIHASLLPAYRGSAPIHRAVMNGEKTSGVTVMLMDEGMDTGDIITMEAVSIDDCDTAGMLHDKLAVLGARLIVDTIAAIEQSHFSRQKQTDEKASYAAPLHRDEEEISWCNHTARIHNQVRGLNPWPGAYTFLNGKRLKIWSGEPSAGDGYPCGMVIAADNESLTVATGDGAYRITQVQPPGKKRMTAGDFLRGNPLKPGLVLGKES